MEAVDLAGNIGGGSRLGRNLGLDYKSFHAERVSRLVGGLVGNEGSELGQ